MTSLPRPVNAASSSLQDRLADVRDRIAAAARRSGRDAGGVTLVGVVKTLPEATIAEAVALGLMDLGENRVQEAELHQQRVARNAATWHMIGHLQRNKAGRALEMFDVFHCLDDLDLAHALAQRAAKSGRRVQTLLEVNVSGESTKFGVSPEGAVELAEQVEQLPQLELKGLMTVGAPVERSEQARAGFAKLRELRERVAQRLARPLPELSMGMSGDFEVAVQEGATMVRVGTAIFGSRHDG